VRTAELTTALAPVRDHALASGREALLAVGSVFILMANKLDSFRSQPPLSAGIGNGPAAPFVG
jgi:hypothetical protein